MSENGDSGTRPGPDRTALVAQPHGGALLRGGNWGNKGGGSAPSAVRAAARKAFAERIPALAGIFDNEAEDGAVRIRALDLMARVGISKDADAIPREAFYVIVKALWTAAQEQIPESKHETVESEWREILSSI